MPGLKAILTGLMSILAIGSARADQVPGFYPGNWAFMAKPDATESEVATACRVMLTTVTEPNDAVTITFETIDPPDPAGGKILRGKIVYKEICPVVTGDTLTCPGRDPASSSLKPALTLYTFKKRPDGVSFITAKAQDVDVMTYYPRPCAKPVIEALLRDAIVPAEAGLRP